MKWYRIRVYFPAECGLPAFTYEDEIQGDSPEDALKCAYWNWISAEHIELIKLVDGQNKHDKTYILS